MFTKASANLLGLASSYRIIYCLVYLQLKEAILHLDDDFSGHGIRNPNRNIHQTLGLCNASLALLNHETLFEAFEDRQTVQTKDNILMQVMLVSLKDVDYK